MRSGILAAGNWIVDRVKTIDAWPAEQTLANIVSESRQNGGAPFNVLVDLARLGATFPLEGLGLIGEDTDGDFILEICRANGIDTSRLVRVPDSTSYTDVMTVVGSGSRTFFHHRGASAHLSPSHFDFTNSRAEHLHLGYLLLLDALDQPDAEFGTQAARVLGEAHRCGLTTSIDVVSDVSGRALTVVPHALPHVDICFMNEIELAQLAQVGVMYEATEELFRLGLKGTAAIHSAEFAFVREPGGHALTRPSITLQQERIKSAVGAGDAFAAGFLFAYLQGLGTETCLEWGVATGASCLLGEGASNGVLPIAEALMLGECAS